MKNKFSNNASLEAMKHADQYRIFVTRDTKVRSEIASILKTNKNEQSNNAIEFLKYWS